MTELTMERLRENLKNLQMKNTLEILDNYLERAVKDELNIVEVLDHIFAQEALSKRRRAYEKQVQCPASPSKRRWRSFDSAFSPHRHAPDRELSTCFWEMRRICLLDARCGKTPLASGLAGLRRHRFSTYYINCHR